MALGSHHSHHAGFTLVELAIGIMIIGLLLGTSMMTLSAQYEQRNRSDTTQLLREVQESLLGFAVANSRLPCPANNASNGVEAFATYGAPPQVANPICDSSEGFVPATTLGLSPRDKDGYLIDAWGNRIRYAVATYVPNELSNVQFDKCPPTELGTPTYDVCPVYTTTQGLLNIGLNTVPKYWSDDPDRLMLRVCTKLQANGIANCDTSQHAVPAAAWSLGKDGIAIKENANGDTTYVYPSEGEADDLIVWISQYTLFSRMRAATAL